MAVFHQIEKTFSVVYNPNNPTNELTEILVIS